MAVLVVVVQASAAEPKAGDGIVVRHQVAMAAAAIVMTCRHQLGRPRDLPQLTSCSYRSWNACHR